MNPKIQKAYEIFKSTLSEAKGKFKAVESKANSNEVDIYTDDGLYCTINIRSGKVKCI